MECGDDVVVRRLRPQLDAASVALIEEQEGLALGNSGLIPEGELGAVARGAVEDDGRALQVEMPVNPRFRHPHAEIDGARPSWNVDGPDGRGRPSEGQDLDEL